MLSTFFPHPPFQVGEHKSRGMGGMGSGDAPLWHQNGRPRPSPLTHWLYCLTFPMRKAKELGLLLSIHLQCYMGRRGAMHTTYPPRFLSLKTPSKKWGRRPFSLSERATHPPICPDLGGPPYPPYSCLTAVRVARYPRKIDVSFLEDLKLTHVGTFSSGIADRHTFDPRRRRRRSLKGKRG